MSQEHGLQSRLGGNIALHTYPPLPPSIRHHIGHPILDPLIILSEGARTCAMEMACLLSSFMTVNSALFVIVSDISSDISSDIPYEKPIAYAKIGLFETMIQCNGGMMVKLNETELKMLIKGGGDEYS